MAAVSIVVSTTRRGRFIGSIPISRQASFLCLSVCVKDPNPNKQHKDGGFAAIRRRKSAAATEAETVPEATEAAARDVGGRCVGDMARAAASGIAVAAGEAPAAGAAAAATAAAARPMGRAVAGLRLAGHRRPISAWLRAVLLARHQRIGRAADGERAHQQQRDVAGALHRRCRRRRGHRPALAEFATLLGHGQMIIEAALSAPAEREASPSQIAEAISPATMRWARSGTGMRTR